jgi:hypothetical protein
MDDPTEIHPELRQIRLNEQFPRGRHRVDVLVGQDILGMILTGRMIKVEPNGPIAIETIFGWAIGGKVNGKYQSNSMISLATETMTNEELSELFEKFWAQENNITEDKEDDPDAKNLSAEELYAWDVFRKTLRFENNRYIVPLIYKENAPELENNFKQAMRRLIFLEKRLMKDPEAMQLTRDAMNEYFKRNDAEPVPQEEINNKDVFYMPHREVIHKDRSTTKCRICFDGSAKGPNGHSLNDCLVTGDAAPPEIDAVLADMRCGAVAIQADISKMFLNVDLEVKDRDKHRFLWRDFDTSVPPRQYRMVHMTFGVKESPFKSKACLHHHAELSNNPEIIHHIKNNTFVDDLVASAKSPEKAIELVHGIMDHMDTANFRFMKWRSNSREVMNAIPKERRGDPTDQEISSGGKDEKTLGIIWNHTADRFYFRRIEAITTQTTYTKRVICSMVARLFDPLGLIAPVTCLGKIIIQLCWRAKIDWDEEVTPNIKEILDLWIRNLDQLAKIRIPRCVFTPGPIKRFELHAFGCI